MLVYVGKLLLTYDKVALHDKSNLYVGIKSLDFIFTYITHIGDGLFAVLVAIVYLFFNLKKTIYILLAYLSAGAVSSIMKYKIYLGMNRPYNVYRFYARKPLIEVNGVDTLTDNSFPSGHALSAFALFFCLIFITKNHFLKSLFFILACLAAYSRVHLSQHWMVDIYFGSLIGTFFSIVFYFVFYINPKMDYLNNSLSQLLKSKKTSV